MMQNLLLYAGFNFYGTVPYKMVGYVNHLNLHYGGQMPTQPANLIRIYHVKRKIASLLLQDGIDDDTRDRPMDLVVDRHPLVYRAVLRQPDHWLCFCQGVGADTADGHSLRRLQHGTADGWHVPATGGRLDSRPQLAGQHSQRRTNLRRHRLSSRLQSGLRLSGAIADPYPVCPGDALPADRLK